jgi:hypothetical protein
MTNSYLRSFVEDQKDKHEDSRTASGKPKKTTQVRTTKAQAAREAAVKDMLEYEEAESQWKMKKFQNVPSRNQLPQ